MSIKYSGTFAITALPSISVSTPSGPFTVGDTVTISWSTTGTVGYVKIQLYKSTSSTATITTSTSNDGSYSWTIQNSDLDGSSSFYKLKISETDGSPVGYSGYFSILFFINEISNTYYKEIPNEILFTGSKFPASLNE